MQVATGRQRGSGLPELGAVGCGWGQGSPSGPGSGSMNPACLWLSLGRPHALAVCAGCTLSTRRSVSVRCVPMRSSSEVGGSRLGPPHTCLACTPIRCWNPWPGPELPPNSRAGGPFPQAPSLLLLPVTPYLPTADLCRDKFSKCGVMASSGLCQSVAFSCARSCGSC